MMRKFCSGYISVPYIKTKQRILPLVGVRDDGWGAMMRGLRTAKCANTDAHSLITA